MTIKSISEVFRDKLKTYYPKEELDALLFYTLNKVLNMTKVQLFINQDIILSSEKCTRIFEIIDKLQLFEPIQYITGISHFYDLTLQVNKSVLIPRPETEELVQWIIKDNSDKELEILDIGTGSGCIAISLAKNLPKAKVTAFDISEEALIVAKKNAERNSVEIKFKQFDILGWEKNKGIMQNFDIIVSNPPYVTNSEKEKMQRNVLDYEPHIALFVGDNDPFVFYKAINGFASKYLIKNGCIYFEINEFLGEKLAKTFNNFEIRKDINGKYRMLKVW